jgi:hypothetical protein
MTICQTSVCKPIEQSLSRFTSTAIFPPGGLTLLLVPLSQPHSWAFAVFVDELHDRQTRTRVE